MKNLITKIKQCTLCQSHLPHGINPIISAHSKSKIAIIGQAPGNKVHQSGVPWDDQSGVRLREWLGVTSDVFYDARNFALVPMGFCYPGPGKNGDLPPRRECAPHWHVPLFNYMQKLEITILIGSYSQNYYLKERQKSTLTETVQCYQEYLPQFFVLPHPSPRNNIWIKKNPWFENELLHELKNRVNRILKK